jgi:parvulin-like peptidyl-prolyl isomerase
MFNYLRLPTLILTVFSLTAIAGEDQDLAPGVMAARGQGTVTLEAFEAKISKIPKEEQAGFLRSAERVRKILSNLLLSEQIAAEARDNGYDQDEQVQMRMRMAADDELAEAWLDHYVDSQPDADYAALAHEHYLANPDKFESGPRIDLTHLLISTEQRNAVDAESLALKYLQQARSDPAGFDQLVIEHSNDPSVSTNKGHFTDVTKGDMVTAFEQAAFALKKKGGFSEPVQTRYGFHIIRLDDIKPSIRTPFKAVRAELIETQKKEHFERIRSNYLKELVSMPVNISEDQIRAMIVRYFGEDQLQTQPNPSNSE